MHLNTDVSDNALVASVVVVVADLVLAVDAVSMLMPDLVDSLVLCCHQVSYPVTVVRQLYNHWLNQLWMDLWTFFENQFGNETYLKPVDFVE